MEIIRQNKKPIIVNVFATFVYKKNLGYVIFSLPCRRWRKLLEVMKTILSAILLLCSTSLLWAQSAEHAFKLAFNHIGVSSIRNTADSLPTDYIRSGKAFGSSFIQYRKTGMLDWTSSQSEDMIREVSTSTAVRRYGPVDNTRNLLTEATFRLIGDELIYELSLSNNSDSPIEIGTLRFSIPYNRLSGESPKQIFEERVLKHHFISGDGSYLFFQRPTGKGPYLVMTPLAGTALEYYDLGDPKSRDNRDFTVYAHAQSTVKEDNVHWRLPLTKGLINPGDTLRYGFRFSWAGDYDAIRQVLVTAGLPDIRIVPGMTVPNNLTVKFAIRSSSRSMRSMPNSRPKQRSPSCLLLATSSCSKHGSSDWEKINSPCYSVKIKLPTLSFSSRSLSQHFIRNVLPFWPTPNKSKHPANGMMVFLANGTCAIRWYLARITPTASTKVGWYIS